MEKWIAVVTHLPSKPQVAEIALRTGLSTDEVLGKLIRFWLWVESHVDAKGRIPVRGIEGLALATELPKSFLEAMKEVGWLFLVNDYVLVPKAYKYFGRRGKTRLVKELIQCRAISLKVTLSFPAKLETVLSPEPVTCVTSTASEVQERRKEEKENEERKKKEERSKEERSKKEAREKEEKKKEPCAHISSYVCDITNKEPQILQSDAVINAKASADGEASKASLSSQEASVLSDQSAHSGNGHHEASECRFLFSEDLIPPKSRQAAIAYGPDGIAFEEWWKFYPRKVGKQDALRAYVRVRAYLCKTRGFSPAEARQFLLERIQAFAQSPKAKSFFCPHASTWLNQGRYDDDPNEWQRPEFPPAPYASKSHPDTIRNRGW